MFALIIGAFLVIGGGGPGGSKTAKTLTVTLRPIGDPGADPFTASVVTISTKDARAFAAKATKTGGTKTATAKTLRPTTTNGGQAGLYGISSAKPVADGDALAQQLTSKPEVASTWADAMGIKPAAIASTINGFTPVLLGADTAVTSHSLVGKKPTPSQVILQAGSPVFIDSHGTPRIDAASGNPLSEPDLGNGNIDVEGDPWDGFDQDNVTQIIPTKDPVTSIEGTDVSTGKPGTIGVGATVSLDGYLVAGADGVSVVSFDGTKTTQVIDHPVARAFDDGQGGIIYQERRSTGDDSSVTELNLAGERPASADEAAIWRLAAGASKPTRIVEASKDLSSWPVLEGAGQLGGELIVVYMTTPAHDYATSSKSPRVTVDVETIRSGKRVTLDDTVSYGGFIYKTLIGGNLLAFALDRGDGHSSEWHFFDQDLKKTTPGVFSDRPQEFVFGLDALTPSGAAVAVRLTEGDGLVLETTANEPQATTKSVAIDIPSDVDDTYCPLIDANAVSALLACEKVLYQVDLRTGALKDIPVNVESTERGTFSFLRAPIIRPAGTKTNTPTTTTTSTPTTTTIAPTPSMNLEQIEAGDYTSLVGTWTVEAYAGNAHDGNGYQWKPGGDDTVSITSDSITIGAGTLRGSTVTYDVGNGPVSAELAFNNNGTFLTSGNADPMDAIQWGFDFYPKGTVDQRSGPDPNNGVTLDNQKDTIIFFVSNNGWYYVLTRD